MEAPGSRGALRLTATTVARPKGEPSAYHRPSAGRISRIARSSRPPPPDVPARPGCAPRRMRQRSAAPPPYRRPGARSRDGPCADWPRSPGAPAGASVASAPRAARDRHAPSRPTARRPPRRAPYRAAPTGRGSPAAARRAGCRRASPARPPPTAASAASGSRCVSSRVTRVSRVPIVNTSVRPAPTARLRGGVREPQQRVRVRRHRAAHVHQQHHPARALGPRPRRRSGAGSPPGRSIARTVRPRVDVPRAGAAGAGGYAAARPAAQRGQQPAQLDPARRR